ncbi:MAG: hypothetical protein WA705_20335 [Candidatus Ozemobacteraceae bacterium]
MTCLSLSTGLFNQVIDRDPHVLETAKHVGEGSGTPVFIVPGLEGYGVIPKLY